MIPTWNQRHPKVTEQAGCWLQVTPGKAERRVGDGTGAIQGWRGDICARACGDSPASRLWWGNRMPPPLCKVNSSPGLGEPIPTNSSHTLLLRALQLMWIEGGLSLSLVGPARSLGHIPAGSEGRPQYLSPVDTQWNGERRKPPGKHGQNPAAFGRGRWLQDASASGRRSHGPEPQATWHRGYNLVSNIITALKSSKWSQRMHNMTPIWKMKKTTA